MGVYTAANGDKMLVFRGSYSNGDFDNILKWMKSEYEIGGSEPRMAIQQTLTYVVVIADWILEKMEQVVLDSWTEVRRTGQQAANRDNSKLLHSFSPPTLDTWGGTD